MTAVIHAQWKTKRTPQETRSVVTSSLMALIIKKKYEIEDGVLFSFQILAW
jgi:hypothetical protein